jgi:hypothetical protein
MNILYVLPTKVTGVFTPSTIIFANRFFWNATLVITESIEGTKGCCQVEKKKRRNNPPLRASFERCHRGLKLN